MEAADTIQAALHPPGRRIICCKQDRGPAGCRPHQPTRVRRVRSNQPISGRPPDMARRASLKMAAGAFAGLILPRYVGARETPTFDQWIAAFEEGAGAPAGITPEATRARDEQLKPKHGLRPSMSSRNSTSSSAISQPPRL